MAINNNYNVYYELGCWVSQKFKYNKDSSFTRVKRTQVKSGEIWYCDLGCNIGSEKNKFRPVLVVSNNKINNSDKVVVICITDTSGKLNKNDLPAQDSWYLLYSTTNVDSNMLKPNREIPINNVPYSFLDKDSIVQCEEIRAVSKVRLNLIRGTIGKLTPLDLQNIRNKFFRAYAF